MPIGWPNEMAPPLTLTMSSLMPSLRVEAMPTAAKASLTVSYTHLTLPTSDLV